MTLFHELGHGVHDLVSRTIYSQFHGTSTVRDFVEAPSQMLENWCWTPSPLKSLSKHYSYLNTNFKTAWEESVATITVTGHQNKKSIQQPPEHIPDELVKNIVRTKHVNAALFNLRQLHFGIFDMTVHEPSDHKAIEDLPISETYNRLRKEIAALDGPEVNGGGFDWANGQATFGHLMGGYDAGYYGYLR